MSTNLSPGSAPENDKNLAIDCRQHSVLLERVSIESENSPNTKYPDIEIITEKQSRHKIQEHEVASTVMGRPVESIVEDIHENNSEEKSKSVTEQIPKEVTKMGETEVDFEKCDDVEVPRIAMRKSPTNSDNVTNEDEEYDIKEIVSELFSEVVKSLSLNYIALR